jgi:arylsulfatase A-like enzyme
VDVKSVIHGTDWLPTVASIVNVELPGGLYDGTDVKAAYFGEKFERNKEIYWTQAGSVAILKNNWKGILTKEGEFRLYDIIKDPAEKENLAGQNPTVAAKIEKSIQRWQKEMDLPK